MNIKDASPTELLNQFLENYNSEVREYNSLVDENEFLEGHCETLKNDLDKLVIKIEQVNKNAEEHMVMLNQANREKLQMKEKLDNALLTVASYKQLGSPKQIRDKIKRYQEKASDHLKATKAHKRLVKEYSDEITMLRKEIKTNV